MTFDVKQLREFIINPALDLCESLARVPAPPYIHDLIVATCAQETHLGTYLHQLGDGPAVSIYQFEPSSLDDLLRNFVEPRLDRYGTLMRAVRVSSSLDSAPDEIIWNLRFATVCARLFYYRVPEALPRDITFNSLWHYYKTYWNTRAGKATEESFVDALALTDIRVAT